MNTELSIVVSLLVYQSTLLQLIERRMRFCPVRDIKAPGRKNLLPFILSALVLMGLLATGCVDTRFTHGTTTMTRRALLTHVSVPSITISTNGTLKASVDSDTRTEVVEMLMRLLMTPQ